MSLIFLSHSSLDELEAIALKQWLLDNGWDDIFLDLDPERGLKAGERWQEALKRAADRCEAVIFIISPAWAKSDWCRTEFLLAKSLNKHIFGVIVKETGLDELRIELKAEYQLTSLIGKGSTEAIQFIHHEQPTQVSFLESGLGRLRIGLQAAGLSASFFPWPPKDDKKRSPYRGLVPLEAQDAAVFFGRDTELLQGLDKLRGMRAAGNECLFVILGPSGSGKSSFLRAGLLPRLKRNSRHFHTLEVIRPERSPLFGERGLANALYQANEDLGLKPVNLGQVKTMLEKGGTEYLGKMLRNIQGAARHRLLELPEDAPSPTLVLPVDQAEELFSSDATAEAHNFLELIGTVLQASLPDGGGTGLSLIVATTIRSDRYEPLQTAQELRGLKTVLFDALKPMPRAQFKEIITGPAKRASRAGKKLEVKPDLIDQLLKDCEQGADPLPLLGLTLFRLYRDYSRDGVLQLDEYKEMGGMAEVITTEVESILSSDPGSRSAQLEILRGAFIPWLATVNQKNNQPVRRRARMADLPPQSHVLVKALIEKRLLLSDMREGEQVIEVAHESLLRQWPILVKWLETEGDDLKEADRLEEAAAAWNKSGKKAAWLMEGERLTIAETLAAKPGYQRRLEPVAEFLLRSRQRETKRREDEERQRQAELVAAQEKQAAAEEQERITKRLAETELKAAKEREMAAETLAAEQRQAAQRLLKRKRQLQTAVIIVLVFCGIAFYGFIDAEEQRKNAEESQRKAQAALASTDFRQAQRYYQSHNIQHALAHLAHAVSLDPEGTSSRTLLVNLLQQKRWFFPIEIFSHEGEVLSARFSPDGTKVVTVSMDETARLWDARTGAPLGEPMRHESGILSAQFSPDGTKVVTASMDHTARLWDARTGAPLGEPMRHASGIGSAQFSPDGTKVVTASGNTARLWDVRTGAPLGEPMRHESGLSAQFSPDGTKVVTASWDSTARLWDARTGAPLGEPMRHEGWVWSAQFSPDGTKVVTASGDHTARLWDARTGSPLGEPMRHEDMVGSAQFSPDGTKVVTASRDSTARLWDARTGVPLGEPMRHESGILSAQFSQDGTKVVTASGNTARLWDISTGAPLGEPLRHESGVLSAQFSPDGTKVVTASEDHTARLWDVRTGVSLGEPLRHEDEVRSAQFSLDRTKVVTASEDRTARLWDVRSGVSLGEPMRHASGIGSAQFSPDGTKVVTASRDQTARLWDARTGAPLGEPMRHEGWVLSAQFSQDGTKVVTASRDQTARLWDARTGAPLGEPLRHEGEVWSAQFSQDGTKVVTASGDTARLWDARTGAPLGEPMRHEDRVWSAQFSPDGTKVLTASGDNTARLWDARTGAPLGESLRHEGGVVSAQFSQDGTKVVTASRDQTARLWNTRTGTPLGEPMRQENDVWSAQFSQDGTRVVTASENTARLWDASTGAPLGEPMRHEGGVASAQFSPDGTKVVTASRDHTARLWDTGVIIRGNKDLLPMLAEAIGGKQLNELGAIESFEDQIGQLNKLREQTANAPLGEPTVESFIRWFLSDPWDRSISPLSKLTVQEYIQQQIDEGRRAQVEQEFPGHPLLSPPTHDEMAVLDNLSGRLITDTDQ